MKKLVIKSLILAALIFGLTGAIIMLVPLPPSTYILAIIDKHKTLEETPGSRLIIAGGSNCAYGIDSAEIQAAMNMPVINMGLTAVFGLGRILDDIRPYAHSGDILLIIPAYHQYFTNLWNGGEDAWMLIFDTGFIKDKQYRLLFSRYYGLPTNFGSYLGQAKINSIPRLFESVDSTSRANTRNAFNKYGDEVAHLSLPPVPFKTYSALGQINQSDINNFFQLVDEFVKKGVTVLFSYPSYDAASFDNSKDTIAQLDRIFRKAKNLTVISTPSEYRMPRKDMYNHVYHLNARGRQIYTARLVADLKAWKATRSKPQTD